VRGSCEPEGYRANYCKALDGKQLLYGTYAVTLNLLKAVLKVCARSGQSGVVSETSVESTVEDYDSQEVKRRKKHIPNNTMETAKKYAKPISTYASVKFPPTAV
jgi:hypothetical protein